MFALDPRTLVHGVDDLALIHDEYEDIHFDEMPILFTGVNRYRSRVLGSSVEEDTDAKIERHFHVLVSPDTYMAFMLRKVSYRQIMIDAGHVFVVDCAFDRSWCNVYRVETGSIPEDYMPLEDSFCPDRSLEGSYIFGASLKGKRADLHQAAPADLRVIESSLPGVVTDAIGVVQRYSDAPPARPMVMGYGPGSFKLRFSVQPTGPINLLGISESAFTLRYVDFCINRFHDEVRELGSESGEEPRHFGELLDTYQKIVNFGAVHRPGDARREKDKTELLTSIRRSVDRLAELAEIVGSNFTSIELFNMMSDGAETLICAFDRAAAHRLSAAVDVYDRLVDKADEDVSPLTYDMVVYTLNTETRRGKAHVFIGDSLQQRVSITISGNKPLEETRFTASLDKSKRISAKARGKRVSGKLKSLRVEYEK
ncbi:hypothetical protein [Sorangium sp. So ce1078]|uniref:hypothetical protein n=1 Tax=Sorangium sp. So ce1078 TaxID=3133329 RepID=UPI003F640D02